jgi:PadR family transcriptional regulator PadR
LLRQIAGERAAGTNPIPATFGIPHKRTRSLDEVAQPGRGVIELSNSKARRSRVLYPAGQSPCVRAILPEGSSCLPREVTDILISETDMSKPNDLVQGTLDLLLLKILALEALHGWAISLRLKSISGDVLQVSEGSLYPALHKLEQEGWITAEWKQTENNRRAKFYSLTRLGGKQLESEAANWQRLSSAISHVVQLSQA